MGPEKWSAARGWLHCGLAAGASAGWLALADGWLQPGMEGALLRWPVMAFSVLGGWTLCALALLAVFLPILRSRPPAASTGLALGVFVGAAPWLHAYMPRSERMIEVALAHSSSLLVALLVAWKVRPGPGPRTAALLCIPPGMVMLLGVALPHELPALRSGAALADDALAAERGERPAAPRGAPDLVLISVDTLRADAWIPDPARPGVPRAPAPFVAGLREGRALWAPWALSSSDQTLPGHVGMLAGMDAFAHGVRDNTETPAPEIRFLAQELRAAGYATAATITNALIGRIHGMDRGYEDFREDPIELATFGLLLTPWLDRHTWLGRCLPERWTAQGFARLFFRRQWAQNARPLGERTLESALGQLAELQAGEAPFFHFVHFMDPHADYAPPPGWRGRLSAGQGAGLPAAMVPGESAPLNGDHLDAIERGLAGADPDTARRAAEFCRLVYLEEAAYVDDCVRRYAEAAARSGRPTVFLLTADHGEMLGEHGLMEHANGLWEENLRVPFLLWGANVPPGELGWIPGLEDIAPTLLTLAGLRAPPEMGGAPVLLPADGSAPNGSRAPSALIAAPAPARAPVAAETREVSVREGALKWTGAWGEAGAAPALLRAVDLAADPFEREPLAQPPPSLLEALARELPRDTWPARARADVGAAMRAVLAGLGYGRN